MNVRTLAFAVAVFVAVFAVAWFVLPNPAPVVTVTNDPPPTTAASDDVECGTPCVITDSPGGSIIAFKIAAYQMIAHKTPIVVDGACLSACTILVDIARDQVCITKNAVFGYHQGYIEEGDKTTYVPIKYSTPGLEKWLKDNGGEPADKYDVLLLPYAEATQFYKPCAGAE